MPDHPVLLAQCLCPQRHCILATASQDQGPHVLAEHLAQQVREAIERQTLNPWCALCGARRDLWTYEVGLTPYATMEEALAALREVEQEQAETARLLKAQGLAYDPPAEEPAP
jgi:hypothetical protein